MTRERDEDEEYERYYVQAPMDDETEAREEDARFMAAKRAASGISAEEIGLMAAAEEGRQAGLQGAGRSMNPYPNDPIRAAEWERWRVLTLGERFNGRTRRVA